MRITALSSALAVASTVALVGCGGSSKNSGSSSGAASGAGGSGGTGGDATSGGAGAPSTAEATPGDSMSSGGTTSGGVNTSSSSGPTSGAPIPLDAYGAAVAEVFCPALAPCCEAMGVSFDTDVCTLSFTLLIGAAIAEADPDSYTYDDVAAGECVRETAAQFDEAACDLVDLDASALCFGVFTGELAPGEACSSNIECQAEEGEDSDCDALTVGGDEVCVVERVASADEDCYWTCKEDAGVQSCIGAGGGRPPVQGQCFANDGLYCSDDGVCVQQGGLGDVCEGSNTCAEGYCASETDQCTEFSETGAECGGDQECGPGSHCVESACTLKLETGAVCTVSNECVSNDCQEGECVEPSDPNALGLAFVCGLLGGGE